MRWCDQQGVVLQHIQPGKPNQNAFIERFNRTYRHEVLDAWVFTSLAEVRQVTDEWLELYNTARPQNVVGLHTVRLCQDHGVHGYAFSLLPGNVESKILAWILQISRDVRH